MPRAPAVHRLLRRPACQAVVSVGLLSPAGHIARVAVSAQSETDPCARASNVRPFAVTPQLSLTRKDRIMRKIAAALLLAGVALSASAYDFARDTVANPQECPAGTDASANYKWQNGLFGAGRRGVPNPVERLTPSHRSPGAAAVTVGAPGC